MASSISKLVLFVILVCLSINKGCSDSPVEQSTHLHFYFHEYPTGANATTLQVVQPQNTTGFTFGSISVIDDYLLEGKDDNSTVIGRAEGLVVETGKQDSSILTMLNFYFSTGAYNGSTLAIYGRIVLGEEAERPVIGGTGVFRMSRGYTIATPVVISSTEFIYEFNVYVWHY